MNRSQDLWAQQQISDTEDAGLRPASARFIEPMRATLAKKAFTDEGFVFERKLDGVRVVAVRKAGQVSLFTRNRKKTDAAYPEIVEALQKLGDPAVDFVLDGEVVALDEAGQTSFALLQRRMQKRDARVAKATGVAVDYFVFDLLNLDGQDIVGLPLSTRKRLLAEIFAFEQPLHYLDHRDTYGETLFKAACANGWEGLIAKRRSTTYVSRRSADWQKLKCGASQEFVIGGFTEPQGSRTGFGALLVGYHDGRGQLRYAGKVGTGFDEARLRALHDALQQIEVDAAPFHEEPVEGGAHWVEPIFVCEVRFTEWTIDGRLRHPSFKGIRSDKAPTEVTREM